MSPEEMMLESISAGLDIIAIVFALAYLWKLWLAAQACRAESPLGMAVLTGKRVPTALGSAERFLGWAQAGAMKRSLEHQLVARRAA